MTLISLSHLFSLSLSLSISFFLVFFLSIFLSISRSRTLPLCLSSSFQSFSIHLSIQQTVCLSIDFTFLRAGLRNPVMITVKEKGSGASNSRTPVQLQNLYCVCQPKENINPSKYQSFAKSQIKMFL